jgi:hypothetical protein
LGNGLRLIAGGNEGCLKFEVHGVSFLEERAFYYTAKVKREG